MQREKVSVAFKSNYDVPVAETEGSKPLIPNPAIGYDPQAVISTSHPHNLFP